MLILGEEFDGVVTQVQIEPDGELPNVGKTYTVVIKGR